MHVRLVPAARLPKGQWAPFVAFALWAALVLSAVQVSHASGNVVGLCHFKRVTGVPCPTCGSTRAVLRAGEGDLGAAFLANPLVFSGLLVLTAVVALRFVAGRRLDFGLSPRQRRAAWIGLCAAVLLNWIYVIVFVG